MNIKTLLILAVVAIALGTVFFFRDSSTKLSSASHSWNNYHWARTTPSFNLKLGDNLTSIWDPYLITTSIDWTTSTVLNTEIVPTKSNSNCRVTNGRVEVCNRKYGNTGWLGIAQIWISGRHITQGTVKVNDTYFDTATYNTTPWRNLVMCQEVGHMFGLSHQNENSNNANLGTCMDYTNDPDGGTGGASQNDPSNEHPNTHDYNQLVTIYTHLDSTTTIRATALSQGNNTDVNTDNLSDWGKEIQKDSRGHNSLYERDLGNGQKLFTFVIWVE